MGWCTFGIPQASHGDVTPVLWSTIRHIEIEGEICQNRPYLKTKVCLGYLKTLKTIARGIYMVLGHRLSIRYLIHLVRTQNVHIEWCSRRIKEDDDGMLISHVFENVTRAGPTSPWRAHMLCVHLISTLWSCIDPYLLPHIPSEVLGQAAHSGFWNLYFCCICDCVCVVW